MLAWSTEYSKQVVRWGEGKDEDEGEGEDEERLFLQRTELFPLRLHKVIKSNWPGKALIPPIGQYLESDSCRPSTNPINAFQSQNHK